MKILLVSHGILPIKGGASVVTESLAANFSKEEMAVVGNKGLLGKTIERLGDVPNFYYINGELNLGGRGRRFFKFFMWFLLPWVVWRMAQVLKKERCNYILGTYPTIHFLVAACLVAKWTRTGFSCYLHNTYLENRTTGISGWFASKVQPWLFEASDFIFVMSEGMAGYYRKQYKSGKFVPILHTFNEFPPEKAAAFDPQKEVFQVALIGNFNQSNIDATGRLIRALKNDPRFNLRFYTPVPKVLLKNRGLDVSAIDYQGYVPDEEFQAAIQSNDIVFLTHGFTGGLTEIEYQTIFPTRTIPLLLSGSPLVAHSPPGAFITNFLKKHDCALVIDEASEERIAEAMHQLIEDPNLVDKLIRNAKKTVRMFHGKEVARNLKEQLSGVVA